MINLLPPEDQAVIRREYLRRLIVMCGSLFFAAVIFSALLLLPAPIFLRSARQGAVLEAETAAARLQTATEPAALATVERLSRQAARLLEADKVKRSSPTAAMTVALQPLPPGVKIMSFSYVNEAGSGALPSGTVTLQGEAITRAALSAYIEALRREARFSEIDLPITALLKSHDLNFSLKMKAGF